MASLKELKAQGVHLPGDVPAGVLCWLIYHGELLGILSEPMSNRVNSICKYKPKEEVPIRLKWMRPVWGELPEDVVAANKRLTKALKARNKDNTMRTRSRVDKAHVNWDRVVKRCRKSIEKLHTKECPGCPWDGKTLFPRKRVS